MKPVFWTAACFMAGLFVLMGQSAFAHEGGGHSKLGQHLEEVEWLASGSAEKLLRKYEYETDDKAVFVSCNRAVEKRDKEILKKESQNAKIIWVSGDLSPEWIGCVGTAINGTKGCDGFNSLTNKIIKRRCRIYAPKKAKVWYAIRYSFSGDGVAAWGASPQKACVDAKQSLKKHPNREFEVFYNVTSCSCDMTPADPKNYPHDDASYSQRYHLKTKYVLPKSERFECHVHFESRYDTGE